MNPIESRQPRKCPRRLCRRLCLAMLLLAPVSAKALVLFDSASVTFSLLGPNLTSRLDPFDSALGTLDTVRVSITGTLTATARTLQNPACLPPTPACVPTPYQFAVMQNVDGLGSQYFSLRDAQLLFIGNTIPDGRTVSGTQFFTIDLTFDSTSDLTGIVDVTSNGLTIAPFVTGRRSDFFTAPGLLDQLRYDLLPSTLFPEIGTLPVFDVAGGASILVQYDYTPVPVAAVSEPPMLGLLLAACAVFGVARRRRIDASRHELS